MRPVDTNTLTMRSKDKLLRRNAIFDTELPRLAETCHEMSQRFLAGGRLLAFGNGSAATDTQHVSVEFAQPDNGHYQVRLCYPAVPLLSPSGITRVILRS